MSFKFYSTESWKILKYQLHHCCFTLASGHPELEIKILYHCTLHSTIEFTKAQPFVEDTCIVMMYTLCNIANVIGHVNVRPLESLQLEGSYIGHLL